MRSIKTSVIKAIKVIVINLFVIKFKHFYFICTSTHNTFMYAEAYAIFGALVYYFLMLRLR